MSESRLQVRIHGRGGQGAVTAAELLAVAAFLEDRHAQAFPSFGFERTGAPVVAFCRISDRLICTREPVCEPDALIVLDPTLVHQVDLFAGGDAVPAERTVTVAVGHGKRAARCIDARLRDEARPPGRDGVQPVPCEGLIRGTSPTRRAPCARSSRRPAARRRSTRSSAAECPAGAIQMTGDLK
jgi:hypothetical protein